MSTETTRRTLGTRLLWIIRTIFVTFLLLIVLLALAGGGYAGFMELQRSFDSVNTQVSANEQAINLLRSDVNGLMGSSPQQQQELAALQSDLDALNGRLANLDSRLGQQETAVADFNTTAAAANEDLAGRTTTLETDLAAMQSDLISNTTQLDTFGGSLDGVRADVTTLGSSVADLEQMATTAVRESNAAIGSSQVVTLTVGDMQDTLVLFRAWELLARARLRLLENNAGLATTDTQLAAQIIATLTIDNGDTLAPVQTRLEQALANLPANPVGAALDLERAWDELDHILAIRMNLPELPTPEPTPVPESTPTP